MYSGTKARVRKGRIFNWEFEINKTATQGCLEAIWDGVMWGWRWVA